MKKLIVLALISFAGFFSANAQAPKTQNEGVVAYSFIRQDIKYIRPSSSQPIFRFDENTDSHGVSASYSRYTKGEAGKVGVLGLTGELAGNFDSNEASVLTAMVGGIAKARNNSIVQPFARALVGVGRQHVNRRNITDTSDVSLAYDFGTGLDFAFKKNSRYGLRTSVDYLHTEFANQGQHGVRLGLGLVF